jgi:hypothetical protein
MPVVGSRQLGEQRLCLFEIGGGEAFGEPVVDRGEKVAGFGVSTLVAAEPGKTRGGAQFPELGLLLPGDPQGFAIEFLGGLSMSLPQQQLAFVPIELGAQPALPCRFRALQSLINPAQGLINLPRDLTSRR